MEEVSSNQYYIILLDSDITVHIYSLLVEAKTMEHIDNYTFVKVIDDLKIVSNKIIILKNNYICVGESKLGLGRVAFQNAVQKCFLFKDIIPCKYASSY